MISSHSRRIGVLFDLDGVLIDTERLYTEFYNDLDRIHPTGVADFAFAIKGTTIGQILERYFPDPAVKADVLRRLHEFEHTMPYPMCPGAESLLERLRDAGIPAVVVTSSASDKMERVYASLPGFRDWFADIVTADDITRSKPHPEPYLTGATRLGLEPECCIVVEDSLQGIESGRAAGATVVGVATTYPRSVIEPMAHITVDSLEQLTLDTMLAAAVR